MSKALLIYADGSEDIEITASADVLARGGVKVTKCALGDQKEVTLAHGTRVICDAVLAEIDGDYDVILIPGGLNGSLACQRNERLIAKLQEQKKAQRIIAAICAAPGFVLAHNGILENEQATGYPGCDEEIKNCTHAGVQRSEDGRFITAKGPAFSMQFALAVLRELEGNEVAKSVATGMLF